MAESELRRLQTSYMEVLDATKHQDDKIGRFVGGIAFLTGATLVFLDQANVLQVRYDLGGVLVPLPATAIIGFLLAIVLSLLLYFVASSAPLTIPGGRRKEGPLQTSHLFFLLIAGETGPTWDSRWPENQDHLSQSLIGEYRREILNLAQRAHAKYRRAQQATAVFIAGLVFFGLAATTTVHRLATFDPMDMPPELVLPWNGKIRSIVALLLSLVSFVLLYQQHENARFVADVVRRRRERDDQRRNERRWWRQWLTTEVRAWALRGLMVSVPVTVALLVIVSAGSDVTRGVIGLLLVVATYSLYLLARAPKALTRRLKPEDDDGLRWRWPRYAVITVGAAVLVMVAMSYDRPAWMLALSIVLALLPLTTTLCSPHLDRSRWLRTRAGIQD